MKNFLWILLLISSCKPSFKDYEDFIPLYPPLIKGVIIKKYIKNESGRPVHHISLKNYNDSIYDLTYIHHDFYDRLEINDSVSKGDSSMNFVFSRDADTILQLNLDFCTLMEYYNKPCRDE